jgi:hypothetical protein
MKPFRTVAPSTEPYDAELTDPRVGQAAWYENNVCAANREAVVAARAAHAMHHGGRHMGGAPRQQPEPEAG